MVFLVFVRSIYDFQKFKKRLWNSKSKLHKTKRKISPTEKPVNDRCYFRDFAAQIHCASNDLKSRPIVQLMDHNLTQRHTINA